MAKDLTFLVGRVIEIMREKAPEGPIDITFPVPGTDHEALLILSQDGPGDGHWRLSIGVVRVGSDRLHSHFLCHGEGQEGLEKVLAYLARPELKMELAASVEELSHRVDQDD